MSDAASSRISDHAMLRYIERVAGIDLDAVRREILTICAGGMLAGARTVRHGGFRYELSSAGKVVTIAPEHDAPRWKARTLEKHLGKRGRR